MCENIKPNGSLNHNKIVRAFLVHCNTPMDSIGLSLARIIFGHQLPNGFKFTANLNKFSNSRVHPVWGGDVAPPQSGKLPRLFLPTAGY